VRAPGPLRAFYERIRARRGFQVVVVATACKMTVLAWHLVTSGQDYAFARPSLVAHKAGKLELAAGRPSQGGNHRRPGAAYKDKTHRQNERILVEQTEKAYEVLVAGWQPKRPRGWAEVDDLIRRAQVDPVLGREVVEHEQHVEIVGDLRDRLAELRAVGCGECRGCRCGLVLFSAASAALRADVTTDVDTTDVEVSASVP
jgi:hypothetical protein